MQSWLTTDQQFADPEIKIKMQKKKKNLTGWKTISQVQEFPCFVEYAVATRNV